MADRVPRGRLDRDRALQLVARHGARARRAADPARQSRGPPRRPGAPHPRGRESRRAGAARPAARAAPAVGLRDHPAAAPAWRPALMAKPAVRLRAVEVVVGGALVCIAGRAAQLQLLEGRRWAEEARAQRTEHIALPARRGALTDRHGTPLALTQETYHVGVAANELRDPVKDVPRIARRLRLATAEVQRALRRRYAYFAGPYSVLDVQSLDAELQEIAQRALDAAIRRMDADGGDVVMMDPATGEVLAVASRRRDGSARPSAFTDTFEPGSVAKIFTAAALLALQRVTPAERVSGEDGKYRLGGRTITDEEPLPVLTLADAIRVSSNIALVKFAARLAPAEQYAMLRDFGFGAFTGIEFPAEATGRLRPPAEWSGVSAGSLAMGSEVSVTPLQLAVAYAALANDGVLLAPTLIRGVRGPAGGVAYRHRPEPVRRVVRPEIAAALRALLRGVVEGGTGAEAALVNFPVAAKTGTARRVVGGRYAPGQYTASFAALFPADRPQLVLVVKIDDPRKGSYFAAQTAAPVTRSMLEQALAARTVALDRARLSTAAPRAVAQPLDDDPGVVPYVVSWPFRPDSSPALADVARRAVPDVTGRPLREAVRALHRRGFRVALKGWGVAHHTWPAAGDSAAVGATVTLFAAPRP